MAFCGGLDLHVRMLQTIGTQPPDVGFRGKYAFPRLLANVFPSPRGLPAGTQHIPRGCSLRGHRGTRGHSGRSMLFAASHGSRIYVYENAA